MPSPVALKNPPPRGPRGILSFKIPRPGVPRGILNENPPSPGGRGVI